MLVQRLQGVPHFLFHLLLGNMLDHMILDPIKDDAFHLGHCLLILFIVSWVNWDSHGPQGKGLNAMSIYNRGDSSKYLLPS